MPLTDAEYAIRDADAIERRYITPSYAVLP